MKFTPKDRRIEEIFSGRNVYEVPQFQRDFSWTEKQYNDFINDIIKTVNLSFDEKKQQIKYNNVTDYFFGTFLLVGDETKPEVEKPYKVIDGQQRLTTMTLFLAAVKDIIDEFNFKLQNKNDEYRHDYNDKLVFNYTNTGKSIEKTRLVNKKLNPILPYDILKLQAYNSSSEVTSNLSQDNLRSSYNLLLSKLSREYILNILNISPEFEWDYLEYIKFIDILGKQVLNSTVICIYSVNESSVNAIYQNFNSKGLPLNDIDLIKNKLFEVLEDDYDETNRLWNEIVDTVFSIDEKIQDFFYYFLNSIGIKANKTKLFENFLKSYEEKDYKEFLETCRRYVKYYKVICQPAGNETVGNIENYFNQDDNFILKENFEILNLSGYSQFRMTFLSLFHAFESDRIKNKDFKKIISIITNYNILNSIKAQGDGSKTNKVTTIYKNMSQLFNKENIDINEAYIKMHGWLNSVRPTKKSIKNSKKVYYSGQKDRTPNDTKARRISKHILIYLEIERMRNKKRNTANKALLPIYNYSIEHIVDKKTKNKEVYDIGNLVLLEQDRHTNIEDKKEMYTGSSVELIKELLPYVEKFNIENIKKRHDKILSEYYDLVTKKA